jgi:hypothetical protein
VSTIRVQKWSDITSFVDFNLNQFAPSSSITSAKLNLKVSAVNLSGKITVHKVLSNWSEQSINHNNRPALGPAIATLNVTNQRNGDTVSVDVTSLVREWLQDPAREYGLALSTTEANVWFASKESGAPAELVVYGATTGGGGSTGNVTLSWLPPTENTDGTALRDLKSYRINWTNVGSSQTGSVAINNPGITTYVVENLATGTYRFTIAALNTAGVSSDPSQAVTTSVN